MTVNTTLAPATAAATSIHEQLEALPDVGYNTEAKARYKSLSMRVLRDLAGRLGLEAGTYDLRYNRGGIAVSGEATLHGDSIYIQISQSSINHGHASVLYRTCDGRQDYRGGRNHFCTPTDMTNIQTLFRMKAMIEAGFDDADRLRLIVM
jgi:hypothetical protein